MVTGIGEDCGDEGKAPLHPFGQDERRAVAVLDAHLVDDRSKQQALVIGEDVAPPVAALPLPDKPSIAVLPFQNMSGDAEQEYFADGMVEEIITTLLLQVPHGGVIRVIRSLPQYRFCHGVPS